MSLLKRNFKFLLSILICIQCKNIIINANSGIDNKLIIHNDSINYDHNNDESVLKKPLKRIKNKKSFYSDFFSSDLFFYALISISCISVAGISIYNLLNDGYKNAEENDLKINSFDWKNDGLDSILNIEEQNKKIQEFNLSWPPENNKRLYINSKNKIIPNYTKGKNLEHYKMENSLSDIIFNNSNSKLVTNLPKFFYWMLVSHFNDDSIKRVCKNFNDFYSQFTCNSYGSCWQTNIKYKSVIDGINNFIKILEDKKCGRLASDFKDLFDVENYDKYGWTSKNEFSNWLNTSNIFAFSGSAHFCKAKQIFEFLGYNDGGIAVIKEVDNTVERYVDIFSIAGYEFRNRPGINRIYDLNFVLENLLIHSEIMMNQILTFANENKYTDIVFIPVGLGVFTYQFEVNERLKVHETMISGWVNSLNKYKGNKIHFHLCVPQNISSEILKVKNENLVFLTHEGQDALFLAYYINEFKNRKSLLINAGDNDWITFLNPFMKPGQFFFNQCFIDPTSDEYFGIHTFFTHTYLRNFKSLVMEDRCISTY